MAVRFFAQLMLLALLASCNPGAPESSSGSAGPDSTHTDSTAVVTPSLPGDAVDPAPSAQLLTPDGWGPLRIGMSRAEVVAAAGDDANPGAVGGPDPEQCDEFRPSRAPDGVLVMIEQGVLTRISVSGTTEIATPAGFRVGDSGARVLDAYGERAQVEPHKYLEPPAQYLTVWRSGASEADRRGLRYEVDSDGEIVHIRAGGPSIEYVEGCL